MPKPSKLLTAPPFPVEATLSTLGTNLRIARLRRNFTVNEIAEKIGVNRKSLLDAEKGKPSTSIAIYVALLWAYGLLDQMQNVADPTKDDEGQALAIAHERQRAGGYEDLDNDF